MGRALKVSADDWPAVKAVLDARELVTGVYIPRMLPVRLDDGSKVAAYGFVSDRRHAQYWSGSMDEAAGLIRQGMGQCGPARDYLVNTVEHLTRLGIGDSSLHRLLRRVDAGRG